MRNKVKRTLSFLLTFVMLCSLLPMTAMAKELQPGEVAASKTASYDAKNHEVTITMTVEGKEASQITPSKADVVLVVDNSGSMVSSVGEPCKTPSSEFKDAGQGWVECPECGAQYIGWFVPDFCTGEKGKEPRIDTAKKVGKTFADSILSGENNNQMAVIGFAHGEKDWFGSTDAIRQKLNLTDNVTDVKKTLDEMVADGGTDYTSALQEAYDMLNDRGETDRPGYVVFISDGAPGKQGSSIGDSNWDGSKQAREIKEAGYGLYTIGIALDDEADDYLESLASDNHYQNVTGRNYASELEELLKEWAEEINTVPAGTNAVMTDTINTGAFEYVEGSAKASTGTISVDNGVVTWNIGDIPAETATATFKVKPIVTPKQDTEYYTNTDVTLTYKDSNDQEQTIPKGQIGEPKVLIPGTEAEKVLLTYDANGGTGEPANEQVEKGKTATLNNTIKPTHVPEGDKEVEFQGWSADKTDIIFESADVVPEGTIIKEIAVGNDPVTVYAVWAYETAQVPETYPVQVVVYQNGNTETPVVTKTIGSYEKGAPFNVDSLNISDYYNSDYGFETTGWFNDGKWNEYKNGQNPAPLQGEITINGWTNVICMVTDWEPVYVFAVTDGDKANKEEIYSGKALKGTDLIAFLDQNVTVPEKEGYNVDKWYNWDWYGNKYAEDTKVNGWTNAYVTYTSNDTDRTVEVTFTVNSEYGSFTDYGKGPVTFKGLPENSTEQYSVPKVTANAGYKFVGWKGQGADVIEWGADASTFGVPGLCYFPEGSDVGYASIEAVFEEVPVSGKTVEVTFTVNPDYGTFTEYGKGPVTFKGLPENSTEQYSVPKVTANAGYKFVGWKGQGADVIEWGADASTFGVPGLCYFPEGSDVGYASIEAVFEEVPVSGKTVEVTFTVNSEYGSFTDYGKGPVTFKNIDAESTQQFEVPKVTAKKGYKFVGWKGQGADVIEWDANASTFGVPGLCYFAEGSNVGYASIAAVFEKEGGGHTNDYYVTVIVDGKGKVKAEDYGTVGSNETEVIIIPDVENSVKFTMEPADGWKVDDVLVDGKSVGDVDSYVLKDDVMLEGPVLKVIFEKKSSGGGGGGSHDKDDDKDKTPAKTPDALNGEDHFDYIVGDADGRVHPERNITRAEVASIFFRLLKDDVRSENLTDQNTFTDVSADAWYNVAVSTMSDMDIVFGRTDYQFDPDAYITRAEFAAIAARFDSGSYSGDDLFTDIEGHWAADQINRAAEKGWITGYPDGTFGPNRYITRAEAVTMINRVLNRMPKDKDALHEDMKVFVDNADTNAWYYLAIQEATNSHEYKKDKDGVYETWTDVLPARDWAQYLKLN